VVCNPRFHRWCYAQGLVNPAEVVVHEINRNHVRRFQNPVGAEVTRLKLQGFQRLLTSSPTHFRSSEGEFAHAGLWAESCGLMEDFYLVRAGLRQAATFAARRRATE